MCEALASASFIASNECRGTDCTAASAARIAASSKGFVDNGLRTSSLLAGDDVAGAVCACCGTAFMVDTDACVEVLGLTFLPHLPCDETAFFFFFFLAVLDDAAFLVVDADATFFLNSAWFSIINAV